MTDLVQAAHGYLERGLHILALNGKRPHPAYHQHWSWDNSIHGVPETDEEEEALCDIFTDPDVTGIAILIPQGVLVADIDSEAAAALFTHLAGEIPDTAIAMSHHGLHVWFMAPGAEANRWLDGQTLLLKGLGGYVVAPPSAFAPCDDNPCPKWHSPYDVYTWVSPQGLVDWLPDGIKERLALLSSTPTVERPKAYESDGFKVAKIELLEGGGFRSYMVHNIDGLVRLIRETPAGNRNNMLAWASMQARDTGVPLATVQEKFTEAAVAAGLSPREVAVTIRAAYRRGARG